jgi:hypothetical protein
MLNDQERAREDYVRQLETALREAERKTERAFWLGMGVGAVVMTVGAGVVVWVSRMGR